MAPAMVEPNPGTDAVATPLEYRSPPRDPDWLFRVTDDRVILVLQGPPAWWQFTSAIGRTLSCGMLTTVAGLPVALTLFEDWRLGDRLACQLATAAFFGVLTVRAAARLRQLIRSGPEHPVYQLTSRQLKSYTRGSALANGSGVLHVDDVVAAPGRLLFNGRRELLLRFLLDDGSLYHMIWHGSRAELERLADALRDALRLNVAPANGSELATGDANPAHSGPDEQARSSR